MAFLQIEDLTGHGELIIFPKKYEELRSYFSEESNNLYYLTATVDKSQVEENSFDEDKDDDEEAKVELKLLAENMIPLLEACENCHKEVCIDFGSKQIADTALFKQILQKHKGKAPFYAWVKVDGEFACQLKFGENWNIKATPEFYRDIKTFCDTQ